MGTGPINFKKMKFFDLGEGKSPWLSLLPLFIALYLLFSMVSISLSQIFLSCSLIFWIIVLIREKQKFIFPSFFWPLLVYAALSLVSSFLSVNPKISLKDSKELFLFLIIPIVYAGFSEEKVLKKANLALLASGYVSSLYYLFNHFSKARWPLERTTGFIGQLMTQAGLFLLFSCMAISLLIFSRGRIRYLWGMGFLLSLVALVLTQVRSSWLGLVIAASLILFFYKPRALIIVPFAVGLFYLASPLPLKKRALSIFSSEYPSNKYRIELVKAGIKIIKDFPLFGTGPDTVEMVYQNPKYGLSEGAKKEVHLHNNIIQIGAERGIPTLLSWFTFMVWVFMSLFKLLKNKDPTLYPFILAALAASLALFTAGLFEYNFADSEITALFLYLITIPFSLARIQRKGVNV
jgi:O-antigen ligase